MINSSYTVIKTKKIAETTSFYERYFSFEKTFESDWYVSLKSGANEIAILDPDHKTIPEKFRGRQSGPETLLNFETDNVDSIYKRFMEDDLKIHLELRDEPWGQRHFISEDPNEIAIDVIKVIPPNKEFIDLYMSDSN